jgi:RNA polymerase sigma factor (sigma-70 family)
MRESFLGAWRTMSGYRRETPLTAWLYRIAIGEAHRRLPEDVHWTKTPQAERGQRFDSMRQADAPGEPGELKASLERFIAQLPRNDRAAIVLRDVEGLSNEEAAVVLGLEVAVFKRRLHDARMTIAQRVGELEARTEAGGSRTR